MCRSALQSVCNGAVLNPKPAFVRGALGVRSYSHPVRSPLPRSPTSPVVSHWRFRLAFTGTELQPRYLYTSSFSGTLQFLIDMHSPHSEVILSFGAHSKMLLTAQFFGPRRRCSPL